ncbi:MAG: thioesterase family protein [Candidatus Thermoplasmatota archaeon]|nr:thioesterase family protein [Candidatus Thermoplasmatota archaeon]
MAPFITEVKVRFHHMDRAGMIFHGAYATFFQDAFEDLMEHVGYVEKDLEASLGIRLPVVQHEMTFPAPPEGDQLTIFVTLTRIGTTSLTFELHARDGPGALCAEATIVRVCIDEAGRPTGLPAELVDALEPHLADG